MALENSEQKQIEQQPATTLLTSEEGNQTAEQIAAAKTAADAAAKVTADQAAADAKVAADAAAATEAERVSKLTAEQKAAEEKAKADAKVVPEKYELKAPEGTTVDPEVTSAFEAKAKTLGLTQQQAQELYDLGHTTVKKNLDRVTADIQKAVADEQASWAAASPKDEEFGGDKFKENLAVAKRAMSFASPELKTFLEKNKLGDHPEMIRLFYRVGKAMTEDGAHVGDPANPKKDMSEGAVAKRFYPNQN